MSLRRTVLRCASLFRSRRQETDLTREIDAHLRLLEDGFVASGMSRDEAKYSARRSFGGVEQAKELHRDTRSFRWLDSWWLDLKLGGRLLVKYPGLTVVGSWAMAFGIAFGAMAFEVGRQLISPSIPLDDGQRIVAIRLRDTSTTGIEPRAAHDFAAWRTGLNVLNDVGAFAIVDRNLTVDGGSAEPIEVAEISASAFTLARVRPLMGRTLTSDDEAPGAAPVVVIGHDVWRTRFAGDRHVVGRVVRLGSGRPTVVGVMPEGFAFPIAQSVWVPWGLRGDEYAPRTGPALQVFGRLAHGVSLDAAQAALTALGQRTATAFPATHTYLRPEVVPYAKSVVDVVDAVIGVTVANVFVVMFLLLVCANVGSLVFARAITRFNEITVRAALGATRSRIVLQLFAEALVLGSVAAVIGLAAGHRALQWLFGVIEADRGRLPFWSHAGLSLDTVLYACALTALSAALAGVVPALKVTGRRLESQLRQSTLRTSGLAFGRMWTVVIVTQVAVTVAFPAAAFLVRQSVLASQTLDAGFPAREYLSARLAVDADDRAAPASLPNKRFARFIEDLQRRLSSEAVVAGVTFTDQLPRVGHRARPVEIEPVGDSDVSPPPTLQRASPVSVALNYFDVLGVRPLAGRSFRSTDVGSAGPVIVNRSFVERIAGGGNPVGRRVRYAAWRTEPASRWFDIVGVVKDLGTIHDGEYAAMYHATSPDAMTPVHIAIHVKSNPASFVPRLRTVAGAVDPELRIHDLLPLDTIGASGWLEFDALWRLLAAASTIALLLSLAGIYSIMSFTVSRCTREIGIRVALGASRWRVTSGIFARAVAQLSLGVAAGAFLVFALTKVLAGLSIREVSAVVGYVAVMAAVCLLACVVPARRALQVPPTEALRAE